jgi:hypothetical protein
MMAQASHASSLDEAGEDSEGGGASRRSNPIT